MRLIIDLKIFPLIVLLALSGQSKMYLVFFIFTMAHEIGHLICGIILGLFPQKIKIMPLGISIMFKKDKTKWWKKILISLAGPLTNITIAGAIILNNTANCEYIVYTNYIIALFNLLPIYPLDGGRVIKAILEALYSKNVVYTYIKEINYIFLAIATLIGLIGVILIQNFFIVFILIYLWLMVILEIKRIESNYY